MTKNICGPVVIYQYLNKYIVSVVESGVPTRLSAAPGIVRSNAYVPADDIHLVSEGNR